MSGSIVCNCNSFGMVDYQMPVRPDLNDYRTSSYRALRHISPVSQEFYGFKLDTFKGQHADATYDIYRTQNSIFHDYKAQGMEEKPNFPPRVHKNNYLRNFKEKLFKNPPIPRTHYIPEYTDEYNLKRNEPSINIPDIATLTTCKLSISGKSEHPRIRTEEPGLSKHADIYMTSSQRDYPPYSLNKMEAARKHIVTYRESNTHPAITICNIRKPMNDVLIFTEAIKDRIIPTVVYRIPFRGKTTEYQDTYIPPTKSCYYTEISHNSGVTYGDSLSNANMSQNLAAPNMYCTEYCHIGSGWPVSAAVSSKDKKAVTSHPICRNQD